MKAIHIDAHAQERVEVDRPGATPATPTGHPADVRSVPETPITRMLSAAGCTTGTAAKSLTGTTATTTDGSDNTATMSVIECPFRYTPG